MKKCCYGKWKHDPKRCLKHPRQHNRHSKRKKNCGR